MLSLHLNKIAMEIWYHLTRCDRRVFKDFFLEHGWNFATTSGCTKVHPNSDRNDNEVQVISDTSHTDQGSATHRRKYASTVPQWINTPCYVLLRQTIITSFFSQEIAGKFTFTISESTWMESSTTWQEAARAMALLAAIGTLMPSPLPECPTAPGISTLVTCVALPTARSTVIMMSTR